MHALSVIIPVRNGETYIAEAIDSALGQGPVVAEIIVVDNGSTDKTASIVGGIADPRVKLITGRSGVSAARNDGLALARGEGLVFLDADDRLRPGALDELLAGFPDDAVAVYGDYERIDAQGRRIGNRHLFRNHRTKPSGAIAERLLGGDFIVNGGIMIIRRAAFVAIGGFDEALRYSEDWHAWCRLSLGGPILYRPIHVLDYRVYEASVMMARPLELNDCLPALDAVFSDPTIVAGFPEAVRSRLRDRALSHLNAYVISQAVRARRFGLVLSSLVETARRSPRYLSHAFVVGTATILGL